MRLRKFTLLISLVLILIIACDEGNDIIVESNAKLIWTGNYDVDGCGFFVEIDSIHYKPENEGIIPPEYRTSEPLSITVQYIDLLYEIEYNCGDLPEAQKSKAIKLTSMDLNQELP
jgi:hypothetical protein